MMFEDESKERAEWLSEQWGAACNRYGVKLEPLELVEPVSPGEFTDVSSPETPSDPSPMTGSIHWSAAAKEELESTASKITSSERWSEVINQELEAQISKEALKSSSEAQAGLSGESSNTNEICPTPVPLL